jgi:hypothetical protein
MPSAMEEQLGQAVSRGSSRPMESNAQIGKIVVTVSR